jgi:DNA-binding PadR family transcriptional regulator
VSVSHVLLGLLERQPSHGYTLKAAYDHGFARDRPLRYGQVYATLARLQRDGLAEEIAVEPGAGPDRRMYAVTSRGVQELVSWLVTPEPPTGYAVSVLFAKTVLALTSGRSAADVLDAQRAAHVARMREVTRAAHGADVIARLAADYEIAHLEADLQWIEIAGARLAPSGDAAPTTHKELT